MSANLCPLAIATATATATATAAATATATAAAFVSYPGDINSLAHASTAGISISPLTVTPASTSNNSSPAPSISTPYTEFFSPVRLTLPAEAPIPTTVAIASRLLELLLVYCI